MDFTANQRLPRPFELSLKSCIILLALVSFVSGDGSVSIANSPEFSSQRICVQQCVWCTALNCYDLAYDLGCPDNPPFDSCFCRTDLTSSALSIISSCANRACSMHSVDVSNALSLYSSYCTVTAPLVISGTTGSYFVLSSLSKIKCLNIPFRYYQIKKSLSSNSVSTAAAPANTATSPGSTQTSSGGGNTNTNTNIVNVNGSAQPGRSNISKIAIGVTVPVVLLGLAGFWW
jgi:hypothetical protein